MSDGRELVIRGSTISLGSGAGSLQLGIRQDCYLRAAEARLRFRTSDDDSWTTMPRGQYSLLIPGLSAGESTLEIQAADRVGGWIDEALVLTLDVDQVWYSRWWARILGVVVLLGIGWSVAAFRGRWVRALNTRLEKQVADRTADLEHANTKLDEALTAQQDLLDVVAHDLRAPIVRQMLHLGTDESGPMVADARVLRRDLSQMDYLLNQLMRTREIEHGFDLEIGAVDLEAIVDAAVERNALQAAAKGISLHVTTSHPGQRVLADHNALVEVLANLIDNSVKYTFPGGRVDVRSGVADDAAVIEVVDTGVGIDASDLPRLFRKFGKASGQPTAGEDSVGLGLFSATQLMNQMGGTITPASTGVGHGTTMTCRISLAD